MFVHPWLNIATKTQEWKQLPHSQAGDFLHGQCKMHSHFASVNLSHEILKQHIQDFDSKLYSRHIIFLTWIPEPCAHFASVDLSPDILNNIYKTLIETVSKAYYISNINSWYFCTSTLTLGCNQTAHGWYSCEVDIDLDSS